MKKNSISKSIRIAICGIRGIPACYGGFETFAEELSTRLVTEGFEVVVYGRKHTISWREPTYKGVEIRLLPTIKQKYLDTPIHSILSFLDLMWRRDVDVVLVCNGANAPFLWMLRAVGLPVILNVDGIERKRGKWGSVGKFWYLLGEFCTKFFPSVVVSDADVIAKYYLENHQLSTTVIPYGFAVSREVQVEEKLNSDKHSDKLCAGDYILYVSRLEPENNAHIVVSAYELLPQTIKDKYPLVIVGDAPYAQEYIAKVHALASKNVIFKGFQFGESYYDLQINARIYIQATEVGGTHPALVEALGFGNFVIANDTPENREVLADAGLFYEKNNAQSLSLLLSRYLSDENTILNFQKKARKRAENHYSWPVVVEKYKKLFKSLENH